MRLLRLSLGMLLILGPMSQAFTLSRTLPRRWALDRELCDAARLGDLARIKKALAAGANVHATAKFEVGGAHSHPRTLTPLGWCAFYDGGMWNGDGPAIARLLFEHGAKPDEVGIFGLNNVRSLHLARILIKNGCQITPYSDEGGRLLNAALAGDTSSVAACLDGGTPVDSRSADSRTALSLAAWMGHSNTVKLLIERGASLHPEGWNDLPIQWAKRSGDGEIIRLLQSAADARNGAARGERD